MEGLSLVHKEVNLSLGVAINKLGSCALLFENFEVISWYSSAKDRKKLINVNECRQKFLFSRKFCKKNVSIFDERKLRFFLPEMSLLKFRTIGVECQSVEQRR